MGLRSMRLRQHNPKTALVLFAGAMVLSALVLSIITWSRMSESIEERGRTRVLIIEWEKLFSALKDAETGQRGFLLTGSEECLQPYNSAVASLPLLFQGIGLMEANRMDDYGTHELATLQKLTDKKIEEIRETIVVMRREGATAAVELVKSDAGKLVMDQIRQHVASRLANLQTSMDRETEDMTRELRWGVYSVVGTCLASLISGLVAWMLLRDAEQQARREERLAAEKRRAEQADREKSIFLATMSHEIRTPMNAILGFGELLVGESKTDKEKRYAQSIVRSGHALLQIINDILDLSKIEAGMMEIRPEATDVRELAAFVQQLFTGQAMHKGVEMKVDLAEDVPRSLMLDSTRLRQILINLAGNAFKFTEKGSVSLRFHGNREGSTRSQYRLVVEVIDTGVGIPADRINEIFKPFVQARARRDAEVRGTGLGLAIVKRLATLMGGTIVVQSEEGRGSTFRLDFPAVEISARLPQSSMPEEPSVDFNDLNPAQILVVDDNPVNRELVRGFFEHTHHSLREAADGREALALMLEKRPDVVLMDIRMPVMDGRTALRALRDYKELDLLPVIAVTASSMAGEEGALRETFDGYVRKPFTRAQLYRELSLFIPKKPLGAPSASPEVDFTSAASWKPLVCKLRDLETSIWPSVRDGMVLSEVVAFTQRLLKLARDYECAPLETYASDLASQCESFSLGVLEKSVESFPELISQIERRLAAA